MKDYWITFDAVTGECTGRGFGYRDPKHISDSDVTRFRDTKEQIDVLFSDHQTKDDARVKLDRTKSLNRSQAFSMKELAARQFLADTADVTDKTLYGGPGVAAIDNNLYRPLRKEYAATYHLTNMTPWQLAESIVTRADAVIDAEVQNRLDILTAEQTLALPTPPIPDE